MFASKEFGTVDDFIPVPLEGSFEVHDSREDCLEIAKKSGIPRFRVCDDVSPFLSKSEVARPTSGLYLVPDRTCRLFYMNSSAGDAEVENFAAKIILKPRWDLKGGVVNVNDLLRNAKNSCVLPSVKRYKKAPNSLPFMGSGRMRVVRTTLR